MRSNLRTCSIVIPVMLCCFDVSLVHAQTIGAPQGDNLPGWLTGWSPVNNILDLTREQPNVFSNTPALLTQPTPRVGLFWTGGNPGALPFDAGSSYAQIRAGWRQSTGDYRRPLDPGRDTRTGSTALGWEPLSANGAAIGRVTVERLHEDDGAHLNALTPYSSNPFTVLDTLGEAMGGTAVRLEGGGGWRMFGRLGVGVTVGFDGREVRSVASAAPRLERVSTTGVTVGAMYDLAGGALQVGVFARRRRMAQTLQTYGVAGGTVVYTLTGYYEPVPFEVRPGGMYFWRRFERDAHAYGVTLGGRAFGLEWVGAARLNHVTEGQAVESGNDPPTDDWDAEGWSLTIAAQRQLVDGTLLATVSGAYATLDGEAVRMDLGEVTFTASESAANVSAELRLMPTNGWQAALVYKLAREDRRRDDALARVGSEVKHWAPALTLEVARALPGGFAISLSGGYSQYAPWGGIPSPDKMSGPYRRWIAPEFALYGTEASARSGSLTIFWRRNETLSLWAQGSLSSLSANLSIGQLQFTPDGSRTHAGIEVGVTMRRVDLR